MKSLPHIILIIATAGAAYFSYVNKNNYVEQKEITERVTGENTKTSANIASTQAELQKEQNALDEAKKQLTDQEAALEKLKASDAAAKRALADSTAKLTEQAEEKDNQQKLLMEVKAVLAGLGTEVTIDNIGQKIEEIRTSKADKTKKLEEINGLAETANTKVTANNKTLDGLSATKQKRDDKISGNAKEAVITSVNNEWGFVIIGAGSNVGFTPQTTLLVTRGGKLIGKIKPTSIEPNLTVADIERASIQAGVSIQAGDRVILEVPNKG